MSAPTLLDPVFPNLGVEAAYRRALWQAVNTMTMETVAEIKRCWAIQPIALSPEAIAQDSLVVDLLSRMLVRLAERWLFQFEGLSQTLSRRFAADNRRATEVSMMAALKRVGWAIEFKPSQAVSDTFDAVVAENAALIRSIPQQFMKSVEGAIWRGVTVGGDLHGIVKAIEATQTVTTRRAAFIARDQNNKARAAFERTHRLRLGLTKAKWMHSGAGKEPRPSHLAFSGHTFDVEKGAYLDGEYIQPGEKPNCGCVSRSILPGVRE